MNYEKAVKNIRKELKDYIEEHKLEALVIGVSGGIDSALVCALAKPVCDELKIKLFGVSLPILSNKEDEINRARKVGINFCTHFKEDYLENAYHQFVKLLNLTAEDKIRSGNIKARLRMIYLYDLAQHLKGLVLSTDNYTELLLGFWTLHGDVGDYGTIQNLWKTEVYEMSRWIAENKCNEEQSKALISCIEAIPTDGLGITNSDLDQLGARDYEEADEILKLYLMIVEKKFDKWLPAEGYHEVIKRHKNTHFKRNNPINIGRGKIENE